MFFLLKKKNKRKIRNSEVFHEGREDGDWKPLVIPRSNMESWKIELSKRRIRGFVILEVDQLRRETGTLRFKIMCATNIMW